MSEEAKMAQERRRSARNIKPTYPTFPYQEDPTRSYNPFLRRPQSDRHLVRPSIPQRDPTTLTTDLTRANTLWESGDPQDRHDAYDLYVSILLNRDLDVLVALRIYLKVISFLIAKDEYEMARAFWRHLVWGGGMPHDPDDEEGVDVESKWEVAWELIGHLKREADEIEAALGEDAWVRPTQGGGEALSEKK